MISSYPDSNNGSQFNMNCTNFYEEDLEDLNMMRNITAFVCSAIVLVILIHLICSKAFSSLFKRLYFYLIVATLVAEVAIGLNIEHLWKYKGQETVCMWLGFFTQFCCVVVFVLSYEIIIHLLCFVVTQIRGSQPFPRCTGSRYCMVALEIVYVVLPLIISAVLAVPPYVKGLYGIAGPWCWVQSLDEDCKPIGLVTQMFFYSMYMSVGIAGIAVSLVFVVVYYNIASSFQNARFLLKQTLYVMLFQCVHILIIMYNLSVRLYTLLTRRHQSFGLWIAHACTIPFGVLVFPLGYWLCFYPVKSNIMKVIHKISKCCKRRSSSSGWQVETLNVTKIATAPRSDRVTQPSYTYYIVSHPDDFSETAPLMVSDTGYDSTMTSHTSRQK